MYCFYVPCCSDLWPLICNKLTASFLNGCVYLFCRFFSPWGLFQSRCKLLCFDGTWSVVFWISLRLWYSLQHPQYRGDASACLSVNGNCSCIINHESLATSSTFTLQWLPPHRTQSQGAKKNTLCQLFEKREKFRSNNRIRRVHNVKLHRQTCPQKDESFAKKYVENILVVVHYLGLWANGLATNIVKIWSRVHTFTFDL